MKLRKCEFCGTEFDAALGQCPLCGKAVQPGAAEPQPVMPAASTAAPHTAAAVLFIIAPPFRMPYRGLSQPSGTA